jgi:hypothetical protein
VLLAETEYVHAAPDCVTAIVLLPTVTVAVRLTVDGLTATANASVPSPLPVSPSVSHVALLAGVHLQPAGAVTLMLPLPPAAENDAELDEIE